MTTPLARPQQFLCLLIMIFVPALQAETIPGLGTASFPTTTHSTEAQHAFMRGMLLLHLFEYQDAAQSFIAAEQADPAFAMAYWGEAMTFNHPVWNQVNVHAGRAVLDKFAPTPEARAQRIADPRERAWMSAVEILYSGDGTKPERDARYAAAMQRLSQAYPKDDEAQLFYALALLGQSEGVRDVPTYLHAAAIAKSVFARNPHHPGAAHYWIHGMDDPQHAAGALVAARALSQIAPDAAHAQHMCSHIFLALGMWDDVVRANIAAVRVTNEHGAAEGKSSHHCGHYNYWLEYGYLQQGRIADATQVVAGCRDEATQSGMAARAHGVVDPDDASVASFAQMQTRFLIDTERWHDDVAAWSVDMDEALFPQLIRAYATGLAAAQSDDVPGAEHALATMTSLSARCPEAFDRAGVPPDDPERRVPDIEKVQLQAAILSAQGHTDQAIATIQHAIELGHALAYAFGPPNPVKPSQEFLGELLLQQKQFAQARTAFEASLQGAPRRTESLLGLAHAEAGLGDKAAATATWRELAQIWKTADPAYTPAAEARRNIAAPARAAN